MFQPPVLGYHPASSLVLSGVCELRMLLSLGDTARLEARRPTNGHMARSGDEDVLAASSGRHILEAFDKTVQRASLSHEGVAVDAAIAQQSDRGLDVTRRVMEHALECVLVVVHSRRVDGEGSSFRG